jgi:hypothetical protein
MKYYLDGELYQTLTKDDALEYCSKCGHCYKEVYDDNSEHLICWVGVIGVDLTEELENEDDNQCECWLRS